MAYIVSVTQGTQAAGASYTVTNGAHISGDLLLNYLVKDADEAAATNSSIGFANSVATIVAAADTVGYAGADVWANGDQVTFTGTTIPGGLTNEVRYFVRDLDTGANTFKVAATVDGAAIDITSTGTAVVVTQVTAGANSPYNGWQMIGVQALNEGQRSAWAFKVAASGAEGNVTYVAGSNDWIGLSIVIRDAHASPFGSLTDGTDYKRASWAAAGSASSAALTTAVDECLLLYSWGIDGNLHYGRCKLNELTALDKYAASNVNYVVGYKQQQSAGSAPSVTMYSEITGEGGAAYTLAIRNKSGGSLQPDLRADINELKWYGTWNEEYDGSTTWAQPSTFCTGVTDFGGIVLSATAPTVATNTPLIDKEVWNTTATSLASTENVTLIEVGGTGAWVGGWHTITSTDLTGKIVGFMWERSNGYNAASQGSQGMLVGFSDGTNYAVYQFASPLLGWLGAIGYFAFVAPGSGTPYDSSGDVAAAVSGCTRIGFFNHRITSATTSLGTYLRDLAVFGLSSLTGGGVTRPAQFQDFKEAITSWGSWKYAELYASAQVKVKTKLQIGDGTNKTYFNGEAQSLEFPQAWSATKVNNWQMEWNGGTAVGLSVKAGDNDTIKLSAGVAATDTLQALTIDAASSTSATYDFGQSFVGWSPAWKTGIACVNATFSGCDPVNFKGTTVTNVIVKNTLAGTGEAAVVFDESGATVTSTSIDGTGAAYAIELGTSVTAITLASCTITAGSTDKIHVLKTTGTVTITISGTTSLVAGDVTSEGATVVIAAPVVYQSVTLTNVVAGSRVQIYDTTNSVELFNDTSGYSWTDTVAAITSGARDIRVRISKVSGASAYEFIEAAIGTCAASGSGVALSYRANQVADAVYNANGVDGSAVTGVTFTDSTIDKMNINISAGDVDLPDLYAAWVYYAFTATGIASDIDYIEAIDTANYVYSNLIWKNTTSPTVPLKISGGYAWDAVTSDPMDLIDTTGGTIFLAPPHVVPKIVSTSSSVVEGTPATVAAAVLSAAQATPIYADIRKVNNYTVDGDGQTGSEWGPA